MEETKTLGRNLTANYALIQGISNMLNCGIYSFASVFLLSRGFSNSLVGLTLTLASGFSLLSQPAVAAFADRSKKLDLRGITAVILAITIFFSIILLIIPPVTLPTMILYILLFVFYTPQIALVTSLAMEHINNGVPINFSLARGIGSFAYAALSFGMGFLVDDFGPWVIMLINIGIGLVGIILVLTFKKAKSQTVDRVDEKAGASGLLEFALQNKRFLAVVSSVSLLFFSHILISTFTIQIIKNVGGDSSNMGIAGAVAAVLELPAMAMFPLIYKRIRNAGLIMKLSGVFMVIKVVITLAAPSVFWVYIAQSFQFFAYAMFIPSSVYYVNQVIRGADKVKGTGADGYGYGLQRGWLET